MSDLGRYDDELERALTMVTDAHPGLPAILLAHSTGGLIVPLWLDLQGKPITRSALTQALRLLGKLPRRRDHRGPIKDARHDVILSLPAPAPTPP